MKPDVVVIGAPKCGTTSLYRYFSQHPDFGISTKKELHYFSRSFIEPNMAGPGDEYALDGCPETIEDYYGCFGSGDVSVDISPSYFVFPECFESIRKLNSDVRVVLVLRNPIEKAFSQYMHLVREARESLSFYDAISTENERAIKGYSDFWQYVSSSMYSDRVVRMIEVFGYDNCLVVFQEELKASPQYVLNKIFKFCGVSSIEVDCSREFNRSGVPKSRLLSRIISPGPILKIAKVLLPVELGSKIKSWLQDVNTGEKLQLSDEERSYLRGRFRSDVLSLERILGRRPPWSEFYD